jgi:hypothetical protein
MANDAKKTYRLFALPMTTDSVARITKERFCRATTRYALVYTADTAPENSVEIGREELHRLTQGDQDWLTDCNFLILAEELKRHETDIAGSIDAKLEAFAEALKAEKNKKEG